MTSQWNIAHHHSCETVVRRIIIRCIGKIRKSRLLGERKKNLTSSKTKLRGWYQCCAFLFFFTQRRSRASQTLAKLRTFEETQISNIIRRAKGKRTLLKFNQFYAKKS